MKIQTFTELGKFSQGKSDCRYVIGAFQMNLFSKSYILNNLIVPFSRQESIAPILRLFLDRL